MLTEAQIWQALEVVKDPEIPTLSMVDMGIITKVEVRGESNVFAKNGKGQFLESYFEIIAIGLYLNIDSYDEVADLPSLQIKLSELSQQTELSQMVGVAGMRAIQRIQRTVQFGRKYFAK